MTENEKFILGCHFDDAMTLYKKRYGETSKEITKALECFENDFYMNAAYNVRNFSVEAWGVTPPSLKKWANTIGKEIVA